MNHRRWTLACAWSIGSVGCGAVMAHHSVAMYQMDKTVTISGTVEKLEWTNPHMWLWVSVQDETGAVKSWGMEGASPANMNRRAGWTKRSLNPGDRVTVDLHPFKDGRAGGALERVVGPGSQVLGTGLGAPGPSGSGPSPAP